MLEERAREPSEENQTPSSKGANGSVDAHNAQSIYNVPGYKPVHTERTHEATWVSGNLPADLEGVYLRNGTNLQFKHPATRLHPFNGSGMLHQVQIANGAATYSNFYLKTPRHVAEAEAGREVYPAFSDIAGGGKAGLARIQEAQKLMKTGQIPALSPLEATTASTSVELHAGRIYCFTEVAYPFVLDAKFDGDKLLLDGTGRVQSWEGRLQAPFTAHPRIDPETDAFFNLSVDRTNGGVFYCRMEDGELVNFRRVHQQDLEAGIMGYLHDYMVTENYVVFPDCSLRSKRELVMSETGSAYYFDDDYKMRWGVLPRDPQDGDEIRWFETDAPGFIWHMINGWERVGENGCEEIVLYAPMFDDYPADVPIHSPKETHTKVKKWVLDLSNGEVSEDKVLIDHHYERPSIHGDYSGKPSRFTYLLDESSGYMGKGFLKYDQQEEKEVGYFSYGDSLGGEPLFVPRAGAEGEDEGYIVDLLMRDEAAELIVVDATSLDELARIHLPSRVPYGVHACWLDSGDLKTIKTD